MPKQKPLEILKLAISNFQGINIERGVLARPINSFERLENFDLVVPGVIRKAEGNRIVTSTPLPSSVLALRDYQKTPGDPEFLLVVDTLGNLYSSGMGDDPITLTLLGNLYGGEMVMQTSPLMVVLPFKEDPNFDNKFNDVQYAVITLGDQSEAKYYDGSAIYPLGIPNPGDSWGVPFEHALACPQLLYDHPTYGLIYQRSSPFAKDGISNLGGRSYRASWYNQLTGHDSSLFPLSLSPLPIEGVPTQPPPQNSATQPLGTVYATPAAPYLMSQPLFLDNVQARSASGGFPVLPPQPGYDHIRIWRTLEGQSDYYLLPTIYNEQGESVTGDNGAIPIAGLEYGFSAGNKLKTVPSETTLYDGFSPATTGMTDSISFPIWYNALQFDQAQSYTLTANESIGAYPIAITLSSLSNVVLSGKFILPNDDTIYTILAIFGAGFSRSFAISPALVVAQVAGTALTILFIRPVADSNTLIPFAETPGPNADRQNDGPPLASWGAVYSNRLFLINAKDPTQLVYSRIGKYEDFPPDNVFRFIQSDYDPLTAVLAGRQAGLVSEGKDQRLVIGKSRSTSQITGTDITNFEQGSLFSETGIVHKRAAIVVEGFFLALSRRGLMLLEDQRTIFIGSPIKDLTDRIRLDEYGPSFASDRRNSQLLLGVQLFQSALLPPPDDVIDTIILMREPRFNLDGSLASPFSTLTLPTTFAMIVESGFGSDIRVLAGGNDGNIYQLLTGGVSGAAETPIVAIAETQLLPQDDKDSNKLFRRITLEGNPVNDDLTTNYNLFDGWFVEFSPNEGLYWTAIQPLWKEVLVGLRSKSLKIRFTHNAEVRPGDEVPMLSNFLLEYSIVGEAR